MKQVAFTKKAKEDFDYWNKINEKTYKKIIELIRDIQNNPFSGLGKPEPLKGNLKGYWSRRINEVDRLVYKITNTDLIIISCRYHYK